MFLVILKFSSESILKCLVNQLLANGVELNIKKNCIIKNIKTNFHHLQRLSAILFTQSMGPKDVLLDPDF